MSQRLFSDEVQNTPSVAKATNMDTYQHSNARTLKLEAAALEKVLRNVTSNLRLPSGRYLRNILNQKSQNLSDKLIKELKCKLEYLHLHLVLHLFFLKKKL